ncbi:MAG: hypothetical protein QNJ72_33945 [Pleurocapsa sp. MO_226.B13]|nr:hypothetical protein [Pleurocapsa sp. MO_226.B13]
MTWNQLITGVPKLCEDVENYRNELKTELGAHVNQDVRYIMLGAMKNDYVSALWIIAGVTMISQDEVRINEFATIVDQEVDKEKIELVFTDYLRKSVITRVYFLLDHYLGSLSKHLTENCNQTVKQNAEAVQQNQKLSASDIDVFLAMGCTRNSFHNNGIHRVRGNQPQISNFNVGKRQYNFKDGDEVALSWTDISILIHTAIETAHRWGQSISNNTLVLEK